MIEKPRRFDLYPDDFIAGVAGELTPSEMGVYSMVILLCYSHGGSIPYDPELLRNKFRPSTGGWAIKRHLDRLIAIGKIVRDGNEITVSRVRDEVERSISRIRVSREHGARGGRPSNKNNDEAKGLGSPARVNNHQPSIINQKNPLKSPKGDDGFDDFWQVYPKKVGKQDALKAWPKAIKAAELSAIVEGARSYAASHEPSYQYWKNPAGWLNGNRWQDQPPTNGGGNGYTRDISPEEHEAARLQARREAGLCADD
jgi:uncharacterized protein YdaU (DUF1376 family)